MRGLVVLVLLVSGCVDLAPSPPGTDGTAADTLPARVAALEGCTGGCWEPMVAIDPEGRIFVVAGMEPLLAVSTDGGLSYDALRVPPLPPGVAEADRIDQTIGTDPEGRLFFAAFLAAPATFAPIGLQVAVSQDSGATWTSNRLLSVREDPGSGVVSPFKMWLAFDPADATAYVAFNQRPGGGVWLGRSDDHGASWGAFVRVQPLDDRIFSTFFSEPVVDGEGRVLLAYFGDQHPNPGVNPFFFQGEELRIAISEDRGETFRHVVIASAPPPGAVGTAFPSLARGEDQALHVAYWDNERIRVATSLDGGETWSAPVAWGDPSALGPWAGVRAGALAVIRWDAQTGDLVLDEGPATSGPERRSVLARGTGPTGDFPHFALEARGRLAAVVGAGETVDVVWG